MKKERELKNTVQMTRMIKITYRIAEIFTTKIINIIMSF